MSGLDVLFSVLLAIRFIFALPLNSPLLPSYDYIGECLRSTSTAYSGIRS